MARSRPDLPRRRPAEARWRDDVLDALVPGLLPADRAAFWASWEADAPRLLRLGLRAAVLATVLAGFRYGRPFPRLAADEKDALLTAIVTSRAWAVRQIGVVLKLVAGFALAWHEPSRARLEPR